MGAVDALVQRRRPRLTERPHKAAHWANWQLGWKWQSATKVGVRGLISGKYSRTSSDGRQPASAWSNLQSSACFLSLSDQSEQMRATRQKAWHSAGLLVAAYKMPCGVVDEGRQLWRMNGAPSCLGRRQRRNMMRMRLLAQLYVPQITPAEEYTIQA